MAPIQGPFGFAVAGDEAAGDHCVLGCVIGEKWEVVTSARTEGERYVIRADKGLSMDCTKPARERCTLDFLLG